MKAKRVLFWNITNDKKLAPDITTHSKDFDVFFSPKYALYDYDIIIINLPNFNDSEITKLNLHYPTQIGKALIAGKIIFCILRQHSNRWGYYKWAPVGNTLQKNLTVSEGGEVILTNKESKYYSLFESFFNSFKFKWNTDLRTTISLTDYDFDVLAFNNGNFPVSFVFEKKGYKVGNGKIIFIPSINEEKLEKIRGFYISLIGIGRDLFKPSKTQKISLTPTPDWIEDCKIKNEDELRTKRTEIDTKLNEFSDIKKILYESGTYLVNPVSIVFEKLGYKTEKREKEGAEDIKITLNEFKGLIEVKGLKTKKSIDKTKAGNFVGQLTGHLKENYPKANHEDIKLILVINYDLDKKPINRRKFETIFTEKALKILDSSEVCVLSTLQLFDIYNKMISKEDFEDLKNTIRDKIENTHGLLQWN